VIAGFNFVVSSYLYQKYLASALATCSLTTPLSSACSSRPWSPATA